MISPLKFRGRASGVQQPALSTEERAKAEKAWLKQQAFYQSVYSSCIAAAHASYQLSGCRNSMGRHLYLGSEQRKK